MVPDDDILTSYLYVSTTLKKKLDLIFHRYSELIFTGKKAEMVATLDYFDPVCS